MRTIELTGNLFLIDEGMHPESISVGSLLENESIYKSTVFLDETIREKFSGTDSGFGYWDYGKVKITIEGIDQ